MSCPICRIRKPKRFCPAEGEKICAVCCGIGREVTIDCPVDCPYLIAAHRYERDHRRPIPPDELPYPDMRIAPDLIDLRQDVVLLLSQAMLETALETRATDEHALAALTAMAETYRTLQSGILYEHAPDGLVARQLYERLSKALSEYKQLQAEHIGFATLKDKEVFDLLVFLLRIARQETNGRPRSRAFIEFLRSSLPSKKGAEEPKRILMS